MASARARFGASLALAVSATLLPAAAVSAAPAPAGAVTAAAVRAVSPTAVTAPRAVVLPSVGATGRVVLSAAVRANAVLRGRLVIAVAKRYRGIRYRAGGTSPHTGFDCSGYTRYVFGKLGVSLPHNSGQQYGVVKHISRKYARAGDLIFFHHGSHIYHVGIYAGHGGVYHASHPGRRTGYERLWTSSVWFGRAA